MDEYIADIINGNHYLVLERAVDEDIQAEKELNLESTTVADRFVDNVLISEGYDLDSEFDDLSGDPDIDQCIDALMNDEEDVTNFEDDGGELSDIADGLECDIDPVVAELDEY